MKRRAPVCTAVALLGFWIPSFAQETHLRLAIVPEETSAGTAADVLTVEFSRNEKLQLLERAEIERVYREQGLNAAKNPARLGQVLGADGLLILKITENTNANPTGNALAGFAAMAGKGREETNHLIEARLVAVKQGVVIGAFRSTWSVPDPVEWAKSVGSYLSPLLPKLSVQAGQAIPISIVNLRSAVKSVEAQQTERQLTALTIERLTREQRLFVLERRRLELLSNEKELAGGSEAEFWNGSYLLEGLIDRDGYSAETITINAQLTPAQGGAPLKIDIKGKRGNFAELVNTLAGKVMEALKVAAASVAWDPASESEKYFDEAKWALKWGMTREAQAAGEASWALGKRDVDCAVVRVNAYIKEIPPAKDCIVDSSWNGAADRADFRESVLNDLKRQYRLGLEFREQVVGKSRVLIYAAPKSEPDGGALERALYLLGLYEQFTATLPLEEPRTNSNWYAVGIDALDAGSRMLQWFRISPTSQAAVADKLAELRKLTRSVADRICQSPSVHNGYFVGDHVATHDTLSYSIGGPTNIFRCMAQYGGLWQERPEDAIALYRKLMESPVFSYIDRSLWFRPIENPRLVAWNGSDRQRIPELWRRFTNELGASTNLICQIEAKAFEFVDSLDENQWEALFDNYFRTILSNRDALITNYVETTYIQSSAGAVLGESPAHLANETRDRMSKRYYSEFLPQLVAINRKYWEYNRGYRQDLANFEGQKRYLANFTPFDFQKFNQTFRYYSYTKPQAMELQPLLAAYKSNLAAQMELKPAAERFRDRPAVVQVGFVEDRVKRALNPPTTPVVINSGGTTNFPSPVAQVPKPAQPNVTAVRVETNALTVERFLKIPLDQLGERAGGVRVIGHRLRDGNLLLDLRYTISFSYRAGPGKTAEAPLQAPGGTSSYAAIAIYDLRNGAWRVALYPEPEPGVFRLPIATTPYGRNLRFDLFRGDVYLSEGERIKKYGFAQEQWTVLKLPGQKPSDLFVLNDRLFAANEESIFEILDGGKATKVLASCRRRPAVTLLDRLETLGQATLYAGAPGMIRCVAGSAVYAWDEADWKQIAPLEAGTQLEISDDGLILCANVLNQSYALKWLKSEMTTPELCWKENLKATGSFSPFAQTKPSSPAGKPTWKDKDVSLNRAPVAIAASNLVFFVERELPLGMNVQVNGEFDANRAELVWLDRQSETPLVIPIRFNVARGPAPTALQAQKISRGFGNIANRSCMIWTRDSLFIGSAATPGVWALPVAELEARLAKEREMVRRAAAK